MIKIFYKNKTLVLSGKISDDNSTAKINYSDKDSIKNCINNLLYDENYSTVIIFGEDEKVMLNTISQDFSLIYAAGGIVSDSSEKILVIKRLGKLDFPKGKAEDNETPEQTAIREVCEECGIMDKDLELNGFLQNSYHIYQLNGQFVLKETSWFKMLFTGNYKLKPQSEEDITDIIWIKRNELIEFMHDTYPSILELATGYILSTSCNT